MFSWETGDVGTEKEAENLNGPAIFFMLVHELSEWDVGTKVAQKHTEDELALKSLCALDQPRPRKIIKEAIPRSPVLSSQYHIQRVV